MQLFDEKKINIYGIAWMDIDYNTKEYLSQNGNPYLKIGLDSKGVFSKIMASFLCKIYNIIIEPS